MIHLYIKRCSHCELLYFGRTTSEDPNAYPGSGVYWRRHLQKHKAIGITVQVRSFRSQAQCTKAALAFSKRYDIVEARNSEGRKIWANQIAENGADGGSVAGTLSAASRKKMSAIHLGLKVYNDGVKQYKLRDGDPLIKRLDLSPGHLPSTGAKISKSKTGTIFSKTHRENIGAAKRGRSPNLTPEQRAQRCFNSGGANNGMFGRTHSKTARRKIAEATRRQHLRDGNPMDRPGARAKLSATQTGKRWFTDGVRNFFLKPGDERCKGLTRGMIQVRP